MHRLQAMRACHQALPVLPEAVQAAAHEVVHGVIGGCHAAEHLAHPLSLLLFPDFLEACRHALFSTSGDRLQHASGKLSAPALCTRTKADGAASILACGWIDTCSDLLRRCCAHAPSKCPQGDQCDWAPEHQGHAADVLLSPICSKCCSRCGHSCSLWKVSS